MKDPANDAVEAMGIVNSSPVPPKSTKSKLVKTAAKGPLGTHQSRKVGGKAIALKATEDAAISAAKIASPLKIIEKGADHPAGSKKQQKSPTYDVVETKGIGDILLVPTTSTPEQKTTETVLHHPARLKNQKKSSSDDAVEAKGIADGTRQSRNATEGHALSSAKSASANAKGPLGTHQSMIIGGKAIALKASKDSAISAAKIASPLKQNFLAA